MNPEHMRPHAIEQRRSSGAGATPRTTPRRGRAIVTVLALLAAAGGAFLLALQPAGGQPGADGQTDAPLSCETLTRMLLRDLCVTPTTLAAVDATDQQVRTIVVAARNLCATQTGGFGMAQRDYEQARASVQTLESLAGAGRGTRESRTQLAAARAELAVATQARDQLLAQVQGIVQSVLSESQRTQLARAQAAGSTQPTVPIEYTLADRTEAQLVALRDSLAEQRRAERLAQAAGGMAPIAPPQDPQAAAIATRIRDRLPAIRTAWTQAIGG